MSFSPKKSKETIKAAVEEARLRAAAKLEDIDATLTKAVSRAKLQAAAKLDDLDVKLSEMSTQRDETYDVHGVPPHFKELYIISGYRSPKASFVQSLLYCFGLNNEMLNFWTHFLPFWFFLWRIVSLSTRLDFRRDSTTWPLLAFMITCCAYPITSSIAHALSSMSSRWRHICFFCDYAGIATYSLGAAIGYRAYSFPPILRNTRYSDIFIPIAIFNACVSVILSCESRFIEYHKLCKIFRLTAFSLPYVWDSIPLLIRFFTTTCFDPESLCASATSSHARQFLLVILTALLYAAHFPERFAPGRFDILGHSHQLFHIFGILATNVQMNAILDDYRERITRDPESVDAGCYDWSLGAVAIVMAFSVLVVVIDSWRMSLYDQDTLDKLLMHLHHCNNNLLMHLPQPEKLYEMAQEKCENLRQRIRSSTPLLGFGSEESPKHFVIEDVNSRSRPRFNLDDRTADEHQSNGPVEGANIAAFVSSFRDDNDNEKMVNDWLIDEDVDIVPRRRRCLHDTPTEANCFK